MVAFLPARSVLCSRYRNPAACKAFRRESSGVVFLDRILDMCLLRAAGVSRSMHDYLLRQVMTTSITVRAIALESKGGTAFPT